ncbi:hypothetical protein [Parasphingorhabdus sp.]|uniref:hypothetical protein n=1 Tax=Parasphingorhabdus sp. TaxID=2709688 RepID=UPI003296E673
MKKVKAFQLTAAVIISTQSVSAFANSSCYGTVSDGHLRADGSVMINPIYYPSYTQICNVKADWKDVSKDVCWGWFSQVNTAVVEARHIRVYSLTSLACDALGTYGNAPAPYYVMLN